MHTNRCESDNSLAIDRDAGAPLENRQFVEVQCVWMGEKARTIAIIGQRRPPVQIPQSNDVFRLGCADGEPLH